MEDPIGTLGKAPPKNRNIFVDALTILFGISSWIGVTSAYLQLPIIVSSAKEGWSLPSYMVVVIQGANVISFAYVLYQKYAPKKLNDGVLIYITLFIGYVASICMKHFHDKTMDIGGVEHSVALLICCFLFAVVGCLSLVLFMPYMGRFRECYLVSCMLGMCLNGFIPSIMALVQGVGGPAECIAKNSTEGPDIIKYTPPPMFGVDTFFEIIFNIFVVCTVAFILLNNLNTCKKEYAAGTIGTGNDYHYEKDEETQVIDENVPKDVLNLSTFNYLFLMLAVVGLSGFGNAILPGLMSYACLPYGNSTYHYTVVLYAIAQPCAGLVAMFFPHTSIRVIKIASFIGAILASYNFIIATQSPTPPLQDSHHFIA